MLRHTVCLVAINASFCLAGSSYLSGQIKPIIPENASRSTKMAKMNGVLTDLLEDRRYPKHLELKKEQLDKISALYKQFEVHLDKVMSPKKPGTETASHKLEEDWKSAIKAVKEIEESLKEILSARQLQSYPQVKTALNISILCEKRTGFVPSFDHLLDLNDQQVEELKKLAQEFENFQAQETSDTEEKITEVRKKAREESLEWLTEKQLQRYQILLGKQLKK